MVGSSDTHQYQRKHISDDFGGRWDTILSLFLDREADVSAALPSFGADCSVADVSRLPCPLPIGLRAVPVHHSLVLEEPRDGLVTTEGPFEGPGTARMRRNLELGGNRIEGYHAWLQDATAGIAGQHEG